MQELSFALPSGPSAAGSARARIAPLGVELAGDVLADLGLVVSELVTNAVRYGPGGDIEVRLQVTGPRSVSGEVVDGGDPSRPPAPREGRGATGGWGLRLVDVLATRWGVREGSTHVWFELTR
jgi:two-component sensor histidine kinase